VLPNSLRVPGALQRPGLLLGPSLVLGGSEPPLGHLVPGCFRLRVLSTGRHPPALALVVLKFGP
jgi:hypothetical protein